MRSRRGARRAIFVCGRSRTARVSCIRSSDTITATYETASTAKHQPSPTAAMSTPAIDGPRMREALTIEELRAMAFGRSSRSSTISTTKACRAGVSKALISPCTSCSTMISPTVMMCISASTASGRRLQRREDLRDHQDAVPVPAIDQHAGHRSEKEHRDLAAEAGDAEQQLRAGEAIDQPARGHAREPRADQRDCSGR